jgi:hypothetical protein
MLFNWKGPISFNQKTANISFNYDGLRPPVKLGVRICIIQTIRSLLKLLKVISFIFWNCDGPSNP